MGVATRRWWLRLHRWLGLGLGLALATVALTGALLVVLKPLDQRLNAQLFAAATPGAPAAALDAMRAAVVQRYGAQASFTLRPPRAATDTFWVRVGGPWHGTAYLDPSNARLLGQRGEAEGAVNWLFELHSALLLGEDGKPLLAVLALAYLLLLATGLLLWWPRDWRQAWRLRLDAGTTRSLFDLHRLAGSLLGLAIAVSISSGAYMAWRPLSRFVTTLAGDTPAPPPRVRNAVGQASLDAMARTARALFPQSGIGYVQLAPGAAVRFRLKLPDDPHPTGLTTVWFHPASGELLAVRRWSELEAGARGNSYIYPLHTGELGGPAHEALNALSGVAAAGLGVTGGWLWWRRRRARAGAAAAWAVRP